MKINFFGLRSLRVFAVFSVISGLALGISQCTGIDKDDIIKLIDNIQRKVKIKFINDDLNENILQNEKLLNERIRLDVDSAISRYENWEKKNYIPRMKNKVILDEIKKSKYTWQQRLIVKDAVYYEFAPDGSEAQLLLGPTMGIRGAWIEPDPREVKDK